MAELKTKKNNASVNEFLDSVSDPIKRQDSYTILEMMEQVTEAPAVMWGDAIIGFGDMRYKYASGRQDDWMLAAFSPRKQNLTVYFMTGLDQYQDLLARLGKHKKTGKGCLYIKRLSDVDQTVLRELIQESVDSLKKRGFGLL